jgi:hypothetical protein
MRRAVRARGWWQELNHIRSFCPKRAKARPKAGTPNEDKIQKTIFGRNFVSNSKLNNMKQKSVICAIVKNEQRFIREWVEYYLKIGFERLYIYEDYGSDSHKEQLLDYIENGQVILSNLEETGFIPLYKKGTIVQNRLYKKFFEMCKNKEIDADWVGFFDVDEFMMFEDGWNLERLEEEFSDCGGVLLSWRCFGANGHLKRPEGKVVDNYTTHMPDGFKLDAHWQWNVKSLVNIKKCKSMKHIHIFNGCEFTDHRNTATGDLTFEKAWINHYYSKSWEDYLDRIFSRGNMQNNFRCLDKFFKVNPDMLKDKKRMIKENRYRHAASTMWISHDLKIISGGNVGRLNELRKKFVQNYV